MKKMMHSKLCKYAISIMLAVLFSGCGGGNNQTTTDSNLIPNLSDKPNVIFIFTDDMGYADVGVQKQRDDVKTPHIDSIAANGAKMTNGYVTAPQCTPSRAALLTGQYQQRFGVDDNRYTPMPLDVKTLGQYFQEMGYATGMVGKWHLEIDQNSNEWFTKNYPNIDLANFTPDTIPNDVKKQYYPNNRGYEDTYFGYRNSFWTTFDMEGNTKEESFVTNTAYRIDVVNNAAVSFIKRHHTQPFYLHVAHYAPHVPLEATQKYLDRFASVDVQRRKYALAMISAVDDGVGHILDTLKEYKLLDNTLIFFISDNGAPIGLDMTDTPINQSDEAWNGSINTPLIGEKGMLSDGGIRVPFLVQWPNKIPAGITINQPVISLDASYTALKAASASTDITNMLDGVDLLPALTDSSEYLDQRALFWRFWTQSAVRVGKWKYVKAGQNIEYLFDMSTADSESKNLFYSNPEKAQELKVLLEKWEKGLARKGESSDLNDQEKSWYDYFFINI